MCVQMSVIGIRNQVDPNYELKAKIAKCKSRLKQIGTTVAMYYSDGNVAAFPDGPSTADVNAAHTAFEVDSSIVSCPVEDDDNLVWANDTTYGGDADDGRSMSLPWKKE